MVVFKLVYGPSLRVSDEKVHCALWSVSNSVKQKIQSLATYSKIYYTGIGGHDMATFIAYQIIVDVLILKLK